LLSDFGIVTLAHSGCFHGRSSLPLAHFFIWPLSSFRGALTASDQYALAVTTYTWPLRQGSFRWLYVRDHRSAPGGSATSLRPNRPEIPATVEAGCFEGLAKEPQQRYLCDPDSNRAHCSGLSEAIRARFDRAGSAVAVLLLNPQKQPAPR